MDGFLQRKNDMLGKVDKSAKASWDEKTLNICEKLNYSNDYYTTSSCSGKCVLIEEKIGKTGDYYLWVNHSLVTFNELNSVIREIINKMVDNGRQVISDDLETFNGGVKEGALRSAGRGIVKFKCDPPAIFVCARDVEKAKELLFMAKNCGFKQSGIMITNKIIGVEIKSGERLEFPIVNEGEILVDESYLNLIVKIANEKRNRGWFKLNSFNEMLNLKIN